jgi:membrane protease YdiL (CAAX protease family)
VTAWLASPQATLVGLLGTQGVLVLVLWHRLRRVRLGWSLVGLGPVLRRGAGRAVLSGAGLGLLALVLSSAVGRALQAWGVDQSAQEAVLLAPLHSAPPGVGLAVVLAGTVVAPVVEEAFFRGYVFRALAVRQGLPLAYMISAGAFALLHQLPTLIPVFFVIGLLLCWAYQHTGNLLAPITAHAVNNSIAFVVALVPSPMQL